jgi:hypothetical protein
MYSLERDASLDTRPSSATHGFRVLPVTAEPSGCPFVRFEADFRDEVSFRRWCAFPGGDGISFSLPGAEALNILKPCDSIIERTFLVFADLPDIRDTRSFSPNSGSPDAQTRGSD